MQLMIELTSYLAEKKKSGSFEFTGGTVAEALIAYGIDIDDVGFITANGLLSKKESVATDGTTYKVYPTIVAG